MTTRIAITEAEILDALAIAIKGDAPNDAKTTREMCQETGLKPARVVKALHAFESEGRLVVHQVLRRSLDGKMKPCAAYTIAPKKGKK